MENNGDRLQKVIAQSGVTSRRKAEELIVAGKVKVNGKVQIKLGTKVAHHDKIEVNGIPLEKEEPVYFLLYKPRGVISSVKDDKDRKVVTDFLPDIQQRVYPIGRLDYDTSGLLLLTNDGDFANMLMHPKHEIEKVYIAKTKGIPTIDQLARLKKGIQADGERLRAVRTSIISTDNKNKKAIVEIVLHEGKNRQIKKMLEAIDAPVEKLKREKYGFLTTTGMHPGEVRELTPHEVKQLRNLATKNIL
ncbi:rRNA pseudouridine synthase [Aquibacillus sp. 3ASR75-11]|uniref:Pseudouridine synthase n=1 Tax=Terrihalobacillus insolitus TaxID=2950438 RepID=A0A9X3WUH0_9BACI|nr:pseudouridine synthase [Terrihalobacillus insolitus]MDC3413091.1 rRNA pseudouridine synthase [Terrihalobacillus insolitus]MDC3424833.1 rRNA pseudouridine synthase [Terrihalobacillus insolitus]